ncbi:MAG: adenylate/guanylate cyclase domain-containing protein [Acidimicrobiales bacterium]
MTDDPDERPSDPDVVPLDPALPSGEPMDGLVALLRALGVAPSEMALATDENTFVLLAIDRLALGQELDHDLVAASRLTGLSEDDVRRIWRSLGFPDPKPDELLFSDEDVRNLRFVAELMQDEVVTPSVTFGMTRVVGSSMARVAFAIIDAVSAPGVEARGRPDDSENAVYRAGGFLPMFPAILEQVWRRHLQAAARRRLLRGDTGGAVGLVVGFADLVGFTAMAQEVSPDELAEVVDRFESLAYDVVVAGGGRVVKMIGDEVMFLVEEPVAAAAIALKLSAASRDTVDLPDVRVGLAIGPVVEREGDAFGATVNLASRATAIADPNTVVVPPELRALLEDQPDLSFRSMRPRALKNIGRVALSVMRRSEDVPATIRETIDERRQQMREIVRERLAVLSGSDEMPGSR